MVERGNTSPSKLHGKTVKYVSAVVQARMIDGLYEELTKEEQDIYRRGRNAKSYTTAKNATVMEYRKATGLEALCGYLYLLGRQERLLELIKKAIASVGMDI